MSARFTIKLSDSFQRDLERLPAVIQKKVIREVRCLETNPFGPPPKIKKLKSKDVGRWRLEVWPYRVRYDVIGQIVALYRVRHRKEIYRN